MAPCYNYSRNLHYRTHSLPESMHYNNQHHMLQHLPPQDQYHAQDKLHAMAHHQAIKKKVNLKRSQTNACDLVMLPPSAAAHHHHRAPLTAGVYEAFLPPPNLNSVGLPLTARSGYHRQTSTSRTQSFYMPNTTQSRSSHNLDMLGQQLGEQQHQQQLAAASASCGYHQQSVIHSGKAFSQLSCSSGREVAHQQHSEQKYHHQHPSSSSSSHPHQLPFNLYHHRSVPNIAVSTPQSHLTTPLFVDCSVEYDLGDHPPVPANSEPLLTIHPEYVVKSRSINSSPYSLHHNTSNHIRGSKIKGVSPKTDILNDTAALSAVINSDKSKSCGGNANMIQSSAARRQLHQQQAAARYNLAARRSAAMSAADAASTSLVTTTKSNTDLVTAAKLEATRKLSVESWDSGIGLMGGNSAVSNNLGASVNSCADSTQSWCGGFLAPTAVTTNVNNSLSCDTITSKNSKMMSTSSAMSALTSSQQPSAYSHAITQHADNLPQYDYHSKTTTLNNNNNFNSNNNMNQGIHQHNNKKLTFPGEYMSYQMAKFYDSLLVHC